MNLNLTIRTLQKGNNKEITISEDKTLQDLRKMIIELYDWPEETLKLTFKGKIQQPSQNSSSLKSMGIQEGDHFVIMKQIITKHEEKSSEDQENQNEQTHLQEFIKAEEQQKIEKQIQEDKQKNQHYQQQQQQQQQTVNFQDPKYEQNMVEILSMNITDDIEIIKKALQISQNKLETAVELILSGDIKTYMQNDNNYQQRPLQDSQQMHQQQPFQSNQSQNNQNQKHDYSRVNDLASYLKTPIFQKIIEDIKKNPSEQNVNFILNKLSMQDPLIYQTIMNNYQDFKELIPKQNEDTQIVSVTQQEKQILDNIVNYGFDANHVLETFLKQNRNEAQTIQYLFREQQFEENEPKIKNIVQQIISNVKSLKNKHIEYMDSEIDETQKQLSGISDHQFENTQNNDFISKGLKLLNPCSIQSVENNGYKVAIMGKQLKQNKTFAIKLEEGTFRWAAFGICDINMAEQNNFKFQINNNKGFQLMATNGQTFGTQQPFIQQQQTNNVNNLQQQQQQPFTKFLSQKGDLIKCEVDIEKKKITFSNILKQYEQVTLEWGNQIQNEDQKQIFHICFVFYSKFDTITYIDDIENIPLYMDSKQKATYEIQNSFSKDFKEKNTQIKYKNQIISKGDDHHKFALLEKPLGDKNLEIIYHITDGECKWMAFGACNKQMLQFKDFRTENFKNDINVENHGLYILAQNGYIFNSQNQEQNKKNKWFFKNNKNTDENQIQQIQNEDENTEQQQEQTGFKFVQGDTIKVKYMVESDSKYIEFENLTTQEKCKINFQFYANSINSEQENNLTKSDQIYPCVVFHYPEDTVTIFDKISQMDNVLKKNLDHHLVFYDIKGENLLGGDKIMTKQNKQLICRQIGQKKILNKQKYFQDHLAKISEQNVQIGQQEVNILICHNGIKFNLETLKSKIDEKYLEQVKLILSSQNIFKFSESLKKTDGLFECKIDDQTFSLKQNEDFFIGFYKKANKQNKQFNYDPSYVWAWDDDVQFEKFDSKIAQQIEEAYKKFIENKRLNRFCRYTIQQFGQTRHYRIDFKKKTQINLKSKKVRFMKRILNF